MLLEALFLRGRFGIVCLMARDVHNDEGQMRGVSIEQEPVALFFVSGFSGLYFLDITDDNLHDLFVSTCCDASAIGWLVLLYPAASPVPYRRNFLSELD